MADQSPLIIVEGSEPSRVDPALADGGLPPAVGVQSVCVFRASRDAPQITDGRGWTYHHHVDMACWRGRLYVGWNSCQRDEDVWPSRELYSTSVDGESWTDAIELFPQGISTPLRMYFFLASNQRMLAIAGLRTDESDTDEDKKGGLVVREIRADHSLGEVFTLQAFSQNDRRPALFDRSGDDGFVQACRELLADTVFLEQQDRGRLLGPRRMKWHDASAWPGGKVPGDNEKWVAGKAFSFFTRPDGAIVGVSKLGWTTISFDNGQTWSQPGVPSTLITGKAKVWSQRTADGRFALVYNPSRRNRFPLAIVTSDDGTHFRDMRIVQGELPIQRYEGLHRSIGPQYVRGISRWSNDGSRDDRRLWLVYSMNKEDIWVSRVETPIKADGNGWNIHRPKWAKALAANDGCTLECRDPYDDAIATRLFPAAAHVTAAFEIRIDQAHIAPMQISLHTKFGSALPATYLILPQHPSGRWIPITLEASSIEPINRISFRTGVARGIGGLQPVAMGSDRPEVPRGFSIRSLSIQQH